MWSTRQGFCTTLQTRVRHSRAWCALHAQAESLFSGSTMHSHGSLSGPGASSLGCPDTDSSRVIRCCATERASQRGAGHGCETNINIPRSIVTPWPRSRAGLPKMASNTCARIQAQCCVRTQRSCSLLPKTTGASRAGWHSLDGLVLLRTRAAFSLPSVGALDWSGPQDIRLRPSFQNSSCIFVRPPEVALLNKLVLENLRTCLSVLAIGVEVAMILTLAGISYGTRDETARRARGVRGIVVRPPASSIISLSSSPMSEKLLPFLMKAAP